MIEKRKYNRVAYQAKGLFEGDGFNVNISIYDLSIKGVLIKSSTPLELDVKTNGKLTINIADDIKVCMNASIARINGCDIGLICNSIDLDSMTNLRKLIELNCGSHELLERDLEELIR
jgi:hypothetical protein